MRLLTHIIACSLLFTLGPGCVEGAEAPPDSTVATDTSDTADAGDSTVPTDTADTADTAVPTDSTVAAECEVNANCVVPFGAECVDPTCTNGVCSFPVTTGCDVNPCHEQFNTLTVADFVERPEQTRALVHGRLSGAPNIQNQYTKLVEDDAAVLLDPGAPPWTCTGDICKPLHRGYEYLVLGTVAPLPAGIDASDSAPKATAALNAEAWCMVMSPEGLVGSYSAAVVIDKDDGTTSCSELEAEIGWQLPEGPWSLDVSVPDAAPMGDLALTGIQLSPNGIVSHPLTGQLTLDLLLTVDKKLTPIGKPATTLVAAVTLVAIANANVLEGPMTVSDTGKLSILSKPLFEQPITLRLTRVTAPSELSGACSDFTAP